MFALLSQSGGPILECNQDSHFTSQADRSRSKDCEFLEIMNREGNGDDYALKEIFFQRLNTEKSVSTATT